MYCIIPFLGLQVWDIQKRTMPDSRWNGFRKNHTGFRNNGLLQIGLATDDCLSFIDEVLTRNTNDSEFTRCNMFTKLWKRTQFNQLLGWWWWRWAKHLEITKYCIAGWFHFILFGILPIIFTLENGLAVLIYGVF